MKKYVSLIKSMEAEIWKNFHYKLCYVSIQLYAYVYKYAHMPNVEMAAKQTKSNE